MPKTKNKTDGNELLEVIVSYVNRNSKEEDVPAGYYPKEWYFDKLNIQRCKFFHLIKKLKKINAVDMILRKRHHNGRMHKMSFYRIDPVLQKKLRIKL
ncbi:hypothetical protein UFOVP144_10 [uncultured Caudovirales phage]|uniref:Helix-turn-helix domain containing protein n=1 Tax=uncultured Caudovirales phage TaxID=2100421 RepID=A0A6J7XN73_9CAUD|nr:hypothetical protein UFOVP144_10 [uncultured Caudovirales phage]